MLNKNNLYIIRFYEFTSIWQVKIQDSVEIRISTSIMSKIDEFTKITKL